MPLLYPTDCVPKHEESSNSILCGTVVKLWSVLELLWKQIVQPYPRLAESVFTERRPGPQLGLTAHYLPFMIPVTLLDIKYHSWAVISGLTLTCRLEWCPTRTGPVLLSSLNWARICGFHFLYINSRILNFIYVWLCWVFVAARAFLQSRQAGPLGYGAQAPLVAEHRLSGVWALVAGVHRHSYSKACGILLHQGSNPCLLN